MNEQRKRRGHWLSGVLFVLIALVAYRLVYFLLPLALAAAIWVVREGRRWYRRRNEAVRAAA